MCFTPVFTGPEPPSRSRHSDASVETVFTAPHLARGSRARAVEACEHTEAGTDPALHGWSVVQARWAQTRGTQAAHASSPHNALTL